MNNKHREAKRKKENQRRLLAKSYAYQAQQNKNRVRRYEAGLAKLDIRDVRATGWGEL